MKPAANSNIDVKGGWWLLCICGCGIYTIKLDEETGLNHVICDHCGADCTMRVFND